MTSNEKILMENQINKIFSIIENSETEEISKIAMETIANKCYDSPLYIFMILKNLLDQIRKGNLKIIQDSKFMIDSIFEEFDSNSVQKILNSEIFRDQIEKIINSKENALKPEIYEKILILSVTENSTLEPVEKMDKISFKILEDFDWAYIHTIENLYSEDGSAVVNSNDNNGAGIAFNKFEMQILFPDKDEIREEIESCMIKVPDKQMNNENGVKMNVNNNFNKNSTILNRKKNNSQNLNSQISIQNKNSNQNFPYEKMKIQNFYKNFSSSSDLAEYLELGGKKRKLDNSNDIKIDEDKIIYSELNIVADNCNKLNYTKEIYFNPIIFILNELAILNSHCNWKTRLCAVTLLTYLQPYLIDQNTNGLVSNTSNDTISDYKNGNGDRKLVDDMSNIPNLLNFYRIEISLNSDIKLAESAKETEETNNILINDKNNEGMHIHTYSLDEIKVIHKVDCQMINKIIFEDIITRLIINSLIDKVVDFNSTDYICLFKELNMKLAFLILKQLRTEENLTEIILKNNDCNITTTDSNHNQIQILLHKKHQRQESETKAKYYNNPQRFLYENILNLLENFLNNYEINKDWQPIFAILIFLKNIFTYDDNFLTTFKETNLRILLFNIILSLMKIDSEEILNLTIQILDKLLQKQVILEFIDINKIFEIFDQFLKLIKKYDDIESGVRFYFNCLYNFVIFFKSKFYLHNLKSLIQILERDLIFFALNKMDCVREKYFEVLNNLIDCEEFKFSDDFLEKNIFIAFQGLCCEINKNNLHTLRLFLVKLISNTNEKFQIAINTFITNYKKFLKLLIKDNLKDLKHFYIPCNEKYDYKEMGMIYTSSFKNDLEKEAVREKFEKKIFYLAPIFSLLIKRKIEFVKIFVTFLKIDLNNPNSIVLSKKLLIFLKVYFHYLELIESDVNKILILNDEILKKLADNSQLNEMLFYHNRKEIWNNFAIHFKIFLDFLIKFKFLENFPEMTKLQTIYKALTEKFVLNTKEVFDIMKILYDKMKISVNEENFGMIYENFQFFRNKIETLENSSNLNLIKSRIRVYSAISLFIHNSYSNTKIEKISTFANPILNCLKVSSKESQLFSRYLIRLLFTVNNWESVGKILFSFFENSVNVFIEAHLQNSHVSQISQKLEEFLQDFDNSSQCFQIISSLQNSSIKYFFKEFSKFEKFAQIQKIIAEYKINLSATNTQNQSAKKITTDNNKRNFSSFPLEKRMIVLVFLMTFVKTKVKCIDFYSFYEMFSGNNFLIFSNCENSTNSVNSHNEIFTKLISIILLNHNKIFSDLNESESAGTINTISINLILQIFFKDIINTEMTDKNLQYEYTTFLFTLIDNLINSEKFMINCSQYLFEILKFINSKNTNLRNIATNIFSKIMRVVTILKMDQQKYSEDEETRADENSESKEISNLTTEKKSLSFIKNFFNQNNKHTCNQLKIRLKENLRSYQITGINWMNFLGNYGLGLALCDDMGLGKTIQTLVCVVNASKIYKEQNKCDPISLVICPNTLILNWINESKKFFYEDEVVLIKIDSDYELKEKIHERETSSNRNRIEIFVTSYEKVRDSEIFSIYEFFYLILDEAHIVKNPKTKCYQSIKKLKSERRIILTGTPIQNNVMELWALFDFLMPGFLGNENDFEIKFHKKIHSNIKKLNLEEKLQENIFQTSLMEIRKRIKPFLMRRLKQDVLKELPDKIIQDYVCEMTPIQKELYSYWDKIYKGKEGDKEIKANLKNKTAISSNSNNSLKIIDSLRKVCNYPGLLLKDDTLAAIPQFKKIKKETLLNLNSSGKFKALEELLTSLNFISNKDNTVDPSISSTNPCIYSNVLNSNLKNIVGNSQITDTTFDNKVLIFTQFKAMVEKIYEMLNEKFSSLKVLKITSDLSNDERINSVSRFNSDPSINILILTTNIGGLGLSLTSANIVIMFDHDWNPMKDLQAMDRAHRIGQKKTVEVFRLITADSIEEKLISLQTFKKYIANNVVDQTKIHETKINTNSFMESLEEFSNNFNSNNKTIKKPNSSNKNNKNKFDLDNEKFDNEMIEIEYLSRLLDEKK